jgi:hypothetical protein
LDILEFDFCFLCGAEQNCKCGKCEMYMCYDCIVVGGECWACSFQSVCISHFSFFIFIIRFNSIENNFSFIYRFFFIKKRKKLKQKVSIQFSHSFLCRKRKLCVVYGMKMKCLIYLGWHKRICKVSSQY